VSFHATEAQRERAILKDPNESLGTKVGAALSFVKHDIAASNEKMKNMSGTTSADATTKTSSNVAADPSLAPRSTTGSGTSSTSY